MDHGSEHGQGTARRLARSGARGPNGLSELSGLATGLVSVDGQPLTARTPRQIAEAFAQSAALKEWADSMARLTIATDKHFDAVMLESSGDRLDRLYGRKA